jgi:hypothetical protein
MIKDFLFYSERRPFRKMALLFTIPCAILPIMIASAGIMTIPFSPLLFKYDFVLFGMVYMVYGYGLFLSWQVHRKLLPILIFVFHLIALSTFIYLPLVEWLGYPPIFSIILTSISNQYFRVGSFECNECNQYEM